jgi:hypothetical protein
MSKNPQPGHAASPPRPAAPRREPAPRRPRSACRPGRRVVLACDPQLPARPSRRDRVRRPRRRRHKAWEKFAQEISDYLPDVPAWARTTSMRSPKAASSSVPSRGRLARHPGHPRTAGACASRPSTRSSSAATCAGSCSRVTPLLAPTAAPCSRTSRSPRAQDRRDRGPGKPRDAARRARLERRRHRRRRTPTGRFTLFTKAAARTRRRRHVRHRAVAVGPGLRTVPSGDGPDVHHRGAAALPRDDGRVDGPRDHARAQSDGARRGPLPCPSSGRPWLTPDGGISGGVVVFRDVSNELRGESRARFQIGVLGRRAERGARRSIPRAASSTGIARPRRWSAGARGT